MNTPLPDWFIADIARAAEIPFKIRGTKAEVCCPFHDDKEASAIITARNVFYCSRCTPGRGWSAKTFCEKLGLKWEHFTRGASAGPRVARPAPVPDEPTFTPEKALAAWLNCFRRARNDDVVEEDREAYDYLISRSLLEAVEIGCYGILGENTLVPDEMGRWWRSGYRIVAALYNQKGEIVSVQGRCIRPSKLKTLFPTGSKVSGAFFADPRAVRILRSEDTHYSAIVLGEGMTDLGALSIASPVPVITAPGTGGALSAVGEWGRGRQVLLALDCDAAGRNALQAVSDALHAHGATRVLRLGWPRGCKDACDMLAAHGAVAISELISEQLAKEAS